MFVPFLSLRIDDGNLRNDIDNAIARVVNRSQFILGEELSSFEQEWADYCGAKYCVGVGNGLDALQMSLMAAGVGPGDEVLVPSSTFIATWFAVSNVGAIPVPIPIGPNGYNLDSSEILSHVTSKTKAIIPVHLYGHPCALEEILDVSSRCGITVIEDAAQAHGAKYQKRRIGANGNLAAWSFYPGKNLGAFGDAGAVTTNSKELADKIRLLRNYGSSTKYHHQIIGLNSRLDELQAAVLRVKLTRLNGWNLQRKEIASRYTQAFRLLLGEYEDKINFPVEAAGTESSWHLYVVSCQNRDAIVDQLSKEGVETGLHYPRDPMFQPAYADYREAQEPNSARNKGDHLFSLPIGPHLNDAQVQHVIQALVKIAQRIYAGDPG